MTRGISEARLRKIGRFYMPDSVLQEFMSKECTELNPWMPIDENTPHKELLLWSEKHGKYVGYFGILSELKHHFTHWCELPDDPK